MNRLSGVIHSLLTCDSGCGIVREHAPDRASQNLGLEVSMVKGKLGL